MLYRREADGDHLAWPRTSYDAVAGRPQSLAPLDVLQFEARRES